MNFKPHMLLMVSLVLLLGGCAKSPRERAIENALTAVVNEKYAAGLKAVGITSIEASDGGGWSRYRLAVCAESLVEFEVEGDGLYDLDGYVLVVKNGAWSVSAVEIDPELASFEKASRELVGDLSLAIDHVAMRRKALASWTAK